MKISEKIRAHEAENRWSFEYYPPKTTQGMMNLYDRIARMTQLGPAFIDITWGAGGTTSDATTQFVKAAHEEYGLETCMHLTCTNMAKGMVEKALEEARSSGCRNILALRGDPPKGATEWTATEGGFEHAIDLVKFIRANHGDYFDIAIAGFPEGHPQSPSTELEMKYLKEKVDAGATFIITQMFYDVDIFLAWVRDVRNAGINVPIVPGIMPIQGWASFQRTTGFSKTIVPQHFLDELEPVKDDDQAIREVGTKLVADMCQKILDSGLGIRGLHFYTMNLEKGTKMVLDALEFTPSVEVVNPLPWRPSLTSKRRTENIRPIFWANRTKSYLSRTESWDEFPNGRWGDSRSPAYGELDGYGISLKLEKDDALKTWGRPTTEEEIGRLFAMFVKGKVSYLPWSDQPAAKETSKISEQLSEVNERGFWTINSQPVVDGVKSDDPVHGWGPRNGYVYQKAYLEFFCSPENFSKLVAEISKDPSVTYYAVNKQGDLRTNTTSEGPNAVTWGVFPGKEIVQPTIVEQVSFMAWKDEAFELGYQWANLYDPSSPSHKVIKSAMDKFYLVNIVHNDYRNSDNSAIFKPFFAFPSSSSSSTQLEETKGDTTSSAINGVGEVVGKTVDGLKDGLNAVTNGISGLTTNGESKVNGANGLAH